MVDMQAAIKLILAMESELKEWNADPEFSDAVTEEVLARTDAFLVEAGVRKPKPRYVLIRPEEDGTWGVYLGNPGDFVWQAGFINEKPARTFAKSICVGGLKLREDPRKGEVK